jgi:hypothetical protein
MARVKFDLRKPKHERIAKRTSLSKRKKPKFSSMNKNKKSSWKKTRGQGR